jgi:hypothetical protein
MDVRIISQVGFKAMNWVHVAYNRVQWRTIVNMVMNLRVP